MHGLSKNSPLGGSLKETFLKETFDVKVRLQVICCLDFTEVACIFACLESLKKLSQGNFLMILSYGNFLKEIL